MLAREGGSTATAEKGSRSRMNICFRCKGGEDQEKKFLVAAEAANLQNLKGHRSVGGMRASVYNAVTIESVKALIAAMEIVQEDRAGFALSNIWPDGRMDNDDGVVLSRYDAVIAQADAAMGREG